MAVLPLAISNGAMPGVVNDHIFDSRRSVKPLHPTFGAEVDGFDLKDISHDDLQEVLALMAKVDRP